MTAATARASIIKFFATAWGGATPLTPVAYDDIDFTIPSAPPVTWLRFIVRHFDAYQASIGSPGQNKFRKDGIVTVQIFAPEKNATQDAVAKADVVVALFQGKSRFEGVIFTDARVNEIGPDGAGWYQVNVKIDFEYDDLA